MQPANSSNPNQSEPMDGSRELRNAELSVCIALAEGARIASLRSVRSGLEFLTQAREPRPSFVPGLATPFQAGPCAGIEECLPTVGPCGEGAPGGPAPDHGDFWQVPWTLLERDDRRAVVQAEGFSRPFVFRKEISLEGATLRVRYTVENRGREALPFLYACHPLFAVEPGDRIVLPAGAEELALYYSRNGRLGRQGTVVAWPRTAEGVDLDRAGSADEGIAEMFYTGRLSGEARGAIRREATGERLEVRFSAEQLPFLGVWLCYGGWPDGEGQARQYAVALEPTTSACNTLNEAVAQGTARTVQAGGSASWEIAFALVNGEAAG